MEQQDLINTYKLRSLKLAKRILDILIIISTAVILISIFIYIQWIVVAKSMPTPLCVGVDPCESELSLYIRNKLLPSMIIPSFLCLLICTPVRIFVGRRLKIHTIASLKTNNYKHQRDLYKLNELKKTRDFQDLF